MKIKSMLFILWFILPTVIAGNSVLQSSSQAVSGELTANFALITKEQAIVLGDNSFVVQYNEQSQGEGFPQNIETLAVINQGGEVIFQGNVHLGVKDAVKYLEESMDRDGSCEFAIYIPEDEEKHKNPKADKKGIITGFIVSKYLDALINEGPLDFGDAPKRYPTYLKDNGARHTIKPKMHLGRCVDSELDGQPDQTASGDDKNGIDDEDGVIFKTTLIPGNQALVEVVASQPGFLSAWIDFNCDGDWSDAGEKVISDAPLITGSNSLNFLVPKQAKTGKTFSRFRFSTARGLSFEGLAPDGEVEDYLVNIKRGIN
jgi:hypothetical protein